MFHRFQFSFLKYSQGLRVPTFGYRAVPGNSTMELVVEAGVNVGIAIDKFDHSAAEITNKLRFVFVPVVFDGVIVRKVLSVHPTIKSCGVSYDRAARVPVFQPVR